MTTRKKNERAAGPTAVDQARPDDDEDLSVAHGSIAHATVIRSGADRTTGLRICYVSNGREFEAMVDLPNADHVDLMWQILRRTRIPISAVRAYRGDDLIEEIPVRMRGASLGGLLPLPDGH